MCHTTERSSDALNSRGFHRRRRDGFTLMEVLISSAIFGVVIIGALVILTNSTKYVADLQLRAHSSLILQHKLEDVRLMTWSQVLSLPGSFTDPSDTNGVYTGSIFNSTYEKAGTVVVVERVTVQVSWTNAHGRVVNNSMSTLITKGGLSSNGG